MEKFLNDATFREDWRSFEENLIKLSFEEAWQPYFYDKRLLHV